MNNSFIENLQETTPGLDIQGLEGLLAEPQLENLTEGYVLSHFDEYQLDYINELQENSSWNEMSIDEKIEAIKNRVAKFCNNTSIDKFWKNPEYVI